MPNPPTGKPLSEGEREIVRHSLGLDRSLREYRNHFCAGAGHTDMPTITALIGKGYMRAAGTINRGQDTIYVVTDAGRAALSPLGERTNTMEA